MGGGGWGRGTAESPRPDAGLRPAPTVGLEGRPAAPWLSRVHLLPEGGRTVRQRQGRRATQEGELPPAGLGTEGLPRRPASALVAGTPRFTWSDGGSGASERAGTAPALPHLGGSERARVTAPHLAGPSLAPTLPARGGAPGWRG